MKAAALLLLASFCLPGQSTRSYVVHTVAGATKVTAEGSPATSVHLVLPGYVISDSSGNLYFSVLENSRVWKMSPGGELSTVAGTGYDGFSGEGGPAASAQINGPSGLALDPNGNLFICDSRNHRIRRVETNGVIRTVAGLGPAGFSGDGEQATAARLNWPS